MRLMQIHIGAATALMIGLGASTAQAAPVGEAGRLAINNETASVIEKAAYRRCWIAGGVRHCRWVGEPGNGNGYGYYDYDEPGYGYGYGYGPGVGFFFRDGRGHGGRFHGHGGRFHGGAGHHR
jgi:hypothetical protein